jgi:hypothetical protein
MLIVPESVAPFVNVLVMLKIVSALAANKPGPISMAPRTRIIFVKRERKSVRKCPSGTPSFQFLKANGTYLPARPLLDEAKMMLSRRSPGVSSVLPIPDGAASQRISGHSYVIEAEGLSGCSRRALCANGTPAEFPDMQSSSRKFLGIRECGGCSGFSVSNRRISSLRMVLRTVATSTSYAFFGSGFAAANAAFACATSCVNPLASFTAISAITLRSMVMAAAFSPAIN